MQSMQNMHYEMAYQHWNLYVNMFQLHDGYRYRLFDGC